MKILLFSSLYPNAEEPARGIFVENRLRHLLEHHGVSAQVVAPVPYFPFKSSKFGRFGAAARVPSRENRHGIDIYHPRYLSVAGLGQRIAPFTMARASLGQMRSLIKAGFDFDLIDAHFLYPDGVAAAWLANQVGKPFVLTARGSDVTQHMRQSPRARRDILKAISTASHTITVSQNLKDELASSGANAANITVLRNGVDTELFKFTGRARMRSELGLSRPTIMFAGWLVERKRVDVILEALTHLEGFDAVIVGSGPLERDLEVMTHRLGLEGRVKFLGQKAPSEMAPYYSAADILMLPSEREGWPNVTLEALACGTPVVVSDVGAARDIVIDHRAGSIVEGDEPADYATAVRQVMRAKVSRDDVRSLALEFSWSPTSDGQYRIFERAVADKNKGTRG